MENINVSINGNENSKSEIVYNNVIQELSKDEQIKYLKSKVILLEIEMKNKFIALLLLLISIIGFSAGIYFLVCDFYVFGSFIIFLTFIGVMIRFYLMYKSILKVTHSMEFDKIEHLRKLLNMKLK